MCWGAWRPHPPPPTLPAPDSAVGTSAAHSGLQSGTALWEGVVCGHRGQRCGLSRAWETTVGQGRWPGIPLPSFMLPWEDMLGRALPPWGQQELLCWEKQMGNRRGREFPEEPEEPSRVLPTQAGTADPT